MEVEIEKQGDAEAWPDYSPALLLSSRAAANVVEAAMTVDSVRRNAFLGTSVSSDVSYTSS